MSKAQLAVLRRLVGLWLCVALCGATDGVQAQSLQAQRFMPLPADVSLPSDSVSRMLQARDGQVWLGTAAGLVRYDGRRLRVFAAQPGGLSHPYVTALLQDEQGGLWVGTHQGLNHVDPSTERLRRVDAPSELAEGWVRGLASAGTQRLWVIVNDALYLYHRDKQRWQRWQPETQEGLQGAQALTSDGEGGVWVAHQHFVWHIDSRGRVQQQLDVSESLRGLAPREREVRVLLRDPKGRLWLGLTGGVRVWDVSAEPARALPDPGLPRGLVYDMLWARDASLWVGMGGSQGLVRWREGQTLQRFGHQHGVQGSLPGDSISALLQDRNGTLWVGCWDQGLGLADLAHEGISRYVFVPGEARGLSSDMVQAFADGPTPEQLWVGTYGGGLNLLSLSDGHSQRVPEGQLPLRHIKALLREPDGSLWVGGDHGLWRWDPRSRRSTAVQLLGEGALLASINTLARGPDGRLWAGTGQGLLQVDTQRLQAQWLVLPGQGNRPMPVDSLHADHHGRLWVGAKRGLWLQAAAGQDFQALPLAPSLRAAAAGPVAVHVVREAPDGRIWLATYQGLMQATLVPGGWEVSHPAGQLAELSQTVFESLELDEQGVLWLGNEHELLRWDPASDSLRSYPAQDWFGRGFNFGASHKGPGGSLYFGGPGVVRLQPSMFGSDAHAPDLVLSDLRLFNHSLQTPTAASGVEAALHRLTGDVPSSRLRQISLQPQDSMVSFEFSALHFARPSLNRYAWKLEGFDETWIPGQKDRAVATYTNLDPGRYVLMAKAANPDGRWSAPQKILEIEVLPPWWRTWWFRTLVVLALLGLGAAALRWRLRDALRQRHVLELEVQARTAQIQEQGRQLSLEKREAEQQRERAEQARLDIARLGEIGRDISAAHNEDEVLERLCQQAFTLLDLSALVVAQVDESTSELQLQRVIERGQHRLLAPLSLQDAAAHPAVRCALQAQDLQLASGSGGLQASVYVPMVQQGRVVGVLGAHRSAAWTSVDLDMLRTLGAYAAVAFDKLQAYGRLQQARSLLMQQEKLAALGGLVAGVAHELNTPIGNSLLVSTTLKDTTQDFNRQLQQPGLRRSALQEFCEHVSEAATLLQRSLEQAASMISGFKQLAVDQASEQRRNFELATLCQEVAQTLDRRLYRGGHQLMLQVAPDLHMDSYPGPLGQVLNNLVINAQLHGFDGQRSGLVRISAHSSGAQSLRLEVMDNGRGMSAEHLKRVFEPFFTTRMGRGGSGLGMHICYTIVTGLLGGQIRVLSEPGQGTRVIMDLPLQAPQHKPAADQSPQSSG
ncbi:two-component regulator propeller domain-containing protein [Roseateles sp. BYS180W]|uniref:histidine kinase n=2 Tax=Roseateles rivi TaxID=3299028 RepID=A0ABW7FUH1_9BURK